MSSTTTTKLGDNFLRIPKLEVTGTNWVPVVLTAEHIVLNKEWKKEVKLWQQGKAIVKQQIAGTIPDSLFMKVRNKTTASEIWQELSNEFQKKFRMVSVDLRPRLQEEHCD
ncbi:hypothetical protein C8J57DRAFT_1071940 [Mycena rebaudengoi]|jgi:hypothetical protein|nr:hypothetical protein C8J57DRAFT_1071940 [Mycena rebaudengoi]